MTALLCDAGPLIATFNRRDPHHDSSVLLLGRWPGTLLIPEPVVGETCNFLRNAVRGGAALEAQFLTAVTRDTSGFEIVDPVSEDRRRAAELVEKLMSGPLGYVDACLIAMAERLGIPDIATVDFKLLGMASPVSRLPLRWVLQES
ncbi:MAG: PIN domain-containing protein [Pseudonocardia sediminis]